MSHPAQASSSPQAAQDPVGHDKVPLSATWREWIANRNSETDTAITDTGADVVVVGSGYGGAVAALRLAEKGYQVLLLERGSEYLPGEFPNHFSQIPKYLRANVPGQPLPMGRASGLVEVSVGQGMVTVTGNGLGGGSLINAGVVIKPDDDVFVQDAWPASIRHGRPTTDGMSLDEAFVKAEAALGATLYEPPQGPSAATQSPPLKTQQLFKLAQAAGLLAGEHPKQLESVKLTIRPDRCTQCGDCASGCNVPGAKGDLRSTYLKRAVATGRVQIVTQAEVYRFAPHLPGDRKTFEGWALWVFATDAQHHKASRQEAGDLHDQDSDPASTLRHIVVPKLIVSAGTLGSSQLLQRSQALTDETLAFSPALGTRLSGNGDALSVLVQAGDRVNAVGHGSLRPGPRFSPANPAHHPHIVGPTITAAIDQRDPQLPLNERVLLQDGAIPGAMARLFEEMLSTSLTLQQMDRWGFHAPLNRAHRSDGSGLIALDPLAASSEIAARAQVWLAMGHDGSPGRILWLPGTDGSAMVMPDPGELITYRAQQALFDRLQGKGIHLHNPLWQALPTGMGSLMSGARPAPTITSVHPLGGCPMSDDPLQGVVSDLGQVWVHQPSHPQRAWVLSTQPSATQRYPESPTPYPGLFVLDGSIVPTSLGCNPLFTITALAERAVSAWPPKPAREEPAASAACQRSRRRLVRTPRLPVQKWAATLREELTAQAGDFKGIWSRPEGGVQKVSLQVGFAVSDFENALKVHDHPLLISQASFTVKSAQGDVSYKARTSGAIFNFLPAPGWHGQGRWPWVWTVGELALPFLVCLAALAASQADGFGLPSAWTGGFAKVSAEWFVVLTTFAVVASLLLLPTWRTFWTWLVMRGYSDIQEGLRTDPAQPRRSFTARWLDLASYVLSLIKQFVHAREKRVMHYDLALTKDGSSGPNKAFPDLIHLSGKKVVMYRATPGDLVRWVLSCFMPRPAEGRAPLRRTYWEQIMDADVTVVSHKSRLSLSAPLFKGRLRMGQDSLFRSSTAQLGAEGDTTTGLLMMSGYALLALRFAVKTHIFDFRLPNYSQVPVVDNFQGKNVELKSADDQGQPVHPTPHWITVQRGWSSGDAGNEPTEPLRLSLLQYKQGENKQGNSLIADEVVSTGGVVRAKAVLLLHAFGQSGQTFTYSNPETPTCLARHLYNAGYEVWVLDSRMSTRSGYAEQACNVDMMGEHDVPAAVDHVLDSIRKDPANGLSPDTTLQIAVVAQCIGSASAWMSVLSGKLDQKGHSKLYAFVSSQVHPVMHGSALTEAKTWLPALVRHAARFVPFAVRGPQDGAGGGVTQMLDRLFSSMPVPSAERTLSDNEDAVATCRRIRFIEAPLFLHQNMSDQTIRDMPLLFGNANVRLFEHARRFVSTNHHRLVDEDGLNRYVTEENARRSVTFPVMLLHGERNELFDVKSARASREWLKSAGGWQPKSVCLSRKAYGHLDVLLGKGAKTDVFTPISTFLDRAHAGTRVGRTFSDTRWSLVTPVYGPVLGWVRHFGGETVVRTSLMVDEFGSVGALNFVVLLDGRPQAIPGNTDFVLVVRPTLPPGTSLNSHAPLNHYVVKRPGFASAATPDIPAYLAIRLDVGVAQTRAAAAFELEVLIFRRTQSLEGISTSDLFDNSKIEAATALKASNFSARSRLYVSGEAIAATVDGNQVSLWASCCRYPGLSVDHERIDSQLKRALDAATNPANGGSQPAMALLLGDQIYADATAGLVDPVSPIERYFDRHLRAFNSDAMVHLQRHVPTLMTPDDHEWIDGYPSAAPLLEWPWSDWSKKSDFWRRQDDRHKWARRSIRVFQKMQGPDIIVPGLGSELPATETGQTGPLRVFLLDTRYSKSRQSGRIVNAKTALALKKWIDSLDDSELPVIACGSVILPGLYENADPANPGPPDTWQHAQIQRRWLLGRLAQRNKPFILLSGDYHVSAALTICKDGKPLGAAIVSPPLYAPLPYANSKPHHLEVHETFQVGGACLSMVVPPGGEALSGSGLARITVVREPGQGFKITVARDLHPMGEAFPSVHPAGQPAQFKAVIELP